MKNKILERHLLKISFLIVVVFVLAGANKTYASRVTTDERINLVPCVVAGVDKPSRCGKLSVFENRKTKKGRRIDLNIVVIPAQEANSAPDPVFALAGGPGQAAAQTVAPLFYRDLHEVNRRRDLVLIDQRGTGNSNPLNCPMNSIKDVISYIGGNYPAESWKTCRRELEKKADLRLYTTTIAMEDLNEARAALGYKQINLFGGSYGSRAALVYLRRHPESVRSVILRAPLPTDGKLPLFVSRDAQAALDKLFDDCAADSKCSQAYPNLRQDLNLLLSRLEAAPANVKTKDPRTGEEVELQITRNVFVANVFYMLFASELSRHLPVFIGNALRGNYTKFLTIELPIAVGLMSQVSTGMYHSILCSEDVPRVSKSEIERESRNTFLGSENALSSLQICKVWGRGKVSEEFYKPVVSNTPVLIISGEVDPTLPPRWGESIARFLPNSRHIIIPGVAHGPSFPGCVQNLVAQFINDASGAALDLKCVKSIRRPEFTLPPPKSGAADKGQSRIIIKGRFK